MQVRRLAEALGAELGWEASEERSRVAAIENFEMHEVASIEGSTEFSVVFAEDAAALGRALASPARSILTTRGLFEQLQARADGSVPESAAGHRAAAVLLVAQPRLAFTQAARLLAPAPAAAVIDPQASVAPSAVLGEDVSIGAFAVVGAHTIVGAGTSIGSGAVLGEGVRVGAHCILYPRVVLYAGVTLGDRVVVHSGAVLGADGFGYVRDAATGAYMQFPQQGTLVIEDDVEIGANTTIDRGALGETRIGRGTKIDNLVHLGHNVSIGADVVIAAQTGISGSSRVGDGAILAGQVGIGDHSAVGPGVILGGQAGVLPHKELTGPGELFWGTPAKPVKQFLRELVRISRLGRLK